MSLQDEYKTGLNNMKFALNHHYRFSNYRTAFLAGFLQVTMICVVQSVNFFAIMTSMKILDVVWHFVALTVISSFDNAFYTALGDDPMKNLIKNEEYEDLYIIKTTTSSNASFNDEENKLEDPTCVGKNGKRITEGQIYVEFSKRTLDNRFLKCIYQFLRTFYVSVYFYFLPFILLLGSYYVPYYL